MILSSLWLKIKEVFKKMTGTKTIESVLHITPAISTDMINAIQLWGDMYENHAYWLHEPTADDMSCVKSLGLAQLIASEKARTALLEFESEVTTPMEEKEVVKREDDLVKDSSSLSISNAQPTEDGESGTDLAQQDNTNTTMFSAQFHPQMTVKEQIPKGPTERAEFLNKQYKKVKKQLRRQLEYGIAKGGLVIKPYVIINEGVQNNASTIENKQRKDNKANKSTLNMNSARQIDKFTMEFDYIQADDFYPLAFNGSGDLIEAAFVQRKVDKDTVYTRVEHHKFENNSVIVTNLAFKATSNPSLQTKYDTGLGNPISLTEVPEWANMAKKVVIEDVNRLMFAYFKMPEANTIDTYSPLGVSGFDKAKGLIEQADRQYSRLLWEFEGGELAIDIDRDALRDTQMRDANGNIVSQSVMGKLQQRLYRPIDLGEMDTYQVFSPQLRDVSIINGLNTILMRIEDVTGLSRGTISDAASSVERTATELKILKQRSYQTNADIQHALQDTLDDLIYVMDVYCDLYNITPKGEYEVSYEWDDSILVDVEAELGKRMTLMQNGIASKLEVRQWYFGETEKQAREALLKVQEENRLAVQENIETQFAIGGFNSHQESPDKLKEDKPTLKDNKVE